MLISNGERVAENSKIDLMSQLSSVTFGMVNCKTLNEFHLKRMLNNEDWIDKGI